MIVVPLLTFLAVASLCRPSDGGVRIALLRAAVIVGGAAALTVEVLSAVHALHRPAFITAWLAALLVTGGLAIRRSGGPRAARPALRAVRDRWTALGGAERLMVGALVGLFGLDLVVAVIAPPNNFDSQTYHLPKIEHWVQQGHAGFHPTMIDRQLAMAPGAEYLLLHLRLLTGGDGAYNLLQLAAGVGAVLAAARIAQQLGGGTRAQLVTALVVGTTPMVVLEATSTQTDLVVACWVACTATCTLDGLRARSGWFDVLLIGVAAGLTLLTKATGLLAAGLLLAAWAAAQLRLTRWRGLAGAAAVGALMVLLAGPNLVRVQDTYGNPLGPAHLRESISMQRHDPPAVLVNALRIAETALQTPVKPLNEAIEAGIVGLAGVLRVDPQDRDITYWNETFPYRSWPPDEDRVSMPAQGVLILLGALLMALRRDSAPTTRLYAAVFWLAVLAYVVTVKWQPWGNRLVVFLLVLGAPLAGLWIAGLRGRRLATWATTGTLVAGVAVGGLAVAYGWPRRLVGPGSVLTTPQLEQRFIREPGWQGDYEWAAAAVRGAGARRVGLVQGYNTWEYPWWILLRGTRIVSMQSLQPGLAPATVNDVDAVLCVKPPHTCEFYVPPAWPVHRRGDVAYALAP
ncbi:glycosyltransferase family 39 protein [Dactylosporangium aurantiacum]|uniref:Glycosyltransferase family 39 protein n=1 Tax=Dactylosporangium aurantiacum TaxID=35754 RepID=A0A9Q9MG30_9ACTN|nr:glycosyltransferase family 39 protein [Dactylosporangium aurantiacum]MDG6100820.1 glycosyltransferase family 39 protein [Dactylosporangium aurantiacum]UWZ55119.1 glycosyltransferase family 39 protein [Dactylosporangium aurantiacum]